MGRIASTFKRLGKVNEIALIPRVLAGYPSLETTRQLVPIMARQGADLVELETGVTVDSCLTIAAEARRANEIPLLFRSRYDSILAYGLNEFTAACAASGVDGLVVPDLPIEAAGEVQSVCQSAGLDLIFLAVSSMDDGYLGGLDETATGFIYCTSLSGVTGDRSELGPDAVQLVERVRQFTDLPLVVDFDISTSRQVAQIAHFADGAAVASAIISAMEGLSEDEIILGVADLVREWKEATVKGIL